MTLRIRELSECLVEWMDHVPSERLALHLATANVHLASLDSNWAGLMVPSKLQAAFGAGRPVLGVLPRDSSVGQWIGESGGGWVVEPGDSGGLTRAVEAALDPVERRRRGRRAREYGKQHFERQGNVVLIENGLRKALKG